MRALLINPNVEKSVIYGKVKEVGNYQMPLGLGYIAAVLRQAGHDVKVIDAEVMNYTTSDVVSMAKRFKPDFIGMNSVTAVFLSAAKLAAALKEEIGAPIFLGGAHVTAITKDAMSSKCFDIGIVGEGELTILELAERLEKGRELKSKSIRGIAYRKGRKVVVTQRRPYIKNLDSLPSPARDLFPPLRLYRPTPASMKRTPLGSLITSRGCPYRCIYCDRSIFGNDFRARSAGNVVDEIEELKYKFGARELKFWDDVINHDKKRLIEICKTMVKRKVDLEWSCIGRINTMDREVLTWMKKAGCWQIAYGIESGNNQVLMNARKSLTVEMIGKVVRLTANAGIEPRGFFMLGLPGDNEKTMQDTIDLACRLPFGMANFYITTLYPNTDLWYKAMRDGEAVMQNWDKYSPVNPDNVTYVTKGLDVETLKRYQKKAYSSFYFRPKYIAKRAFATRNFQQLKLQIDGALSILKV